MEDKFESGWYIDNIGREWFGVQRNGTKTIVFNSRDSMTACNPETFRSWGWVRFQPTSHPDTPPT